VARYLVFGKDGEVVVFDFDTQGNRAIRLRGEEGRFWEADFVSYKYRDAGNRLLTRDVEKITPETDLKLIDPEDETSMRKIRIKEIYGRHDFIW
jgi:hypothetical protein